MSERVFSPAGYIVILAILAGLTLLTVGLSFIPSSPVMRIVAGQSIAVVKASLVVLFFMHALHSPVQTRATIAVTIVWLVVLFFGLTFSDYASRGLIPVPGH